VSKDLLMDDKVLNLWNVDALRHPPPDDEPLTRDYEPSVVRVDQHTHKTHSLFFYDTTTRHGDDADTTTMPDPCSESVPP
jgi:hypothetical protein